MANLPIQNFPTEATEYGDDDYLPMSSPERTAKIKAKNLAQNALASIKNLSDKSDGYLPLNDNNGTGKFDIISLFKNFAGEYVPGTTNALANHLYVYKGVLFEAKTDYSGDWDWDKFTRVNLFEELYARNANAEFSQKIDRDGLTDDSYVNPNNGAVVSLSNRYRSKFLLITSPYISVSCPGLQYRVTFYGDNALQFSSAIDLSSDVNTKWQDGSYSKLIKVPQGAILCILSFKRPDDLAIDDDADVSISVHSHGGYGVCPATVAYSGNNAAISSSASRYIFRPLYINNDYPIAEFIKVVAPDNVSFKVHCFTADNLINGYNYDTPWQEGSGTRRLALGRVMYIVEFKKTDGTALKLDDLYHINCSFISDNVPLGLRVSVLGDSLSTFGGSTSDPNDARYAVEGDPTYSGNRCRYPQTDLLTQWEQTYWKRVIDHFGLKFGISESWAGSRVSNTSATDSGDLGPNRCISSQTRIDHLAVNGTPDLIIVNGGTNDIGNNVTIGTFNYESPKNYTSEQIAALDVSTFANAYRAMLIRLQKTYPDARILCMLPNYTNSYYDSQKADAYCEVIKEACDYFGLEVFDSRKIGISLFDTTTFLPDGVHYNANGMLLIAQALFYAVSKVCLIKQS